MVQTIPPHEARRAVDEGAALIDVRTALEFAEVHATPARLVPLDRLDREAVTSVAPSPSQTICLICKSGTRATKAAEKLVREGFTNIRVVEGGTDGWVSAGLPVERRANVISLERQVRIAAGAIVLTGALLAVFVHPAIVWVCAFVGLGLIVAGITNFCGMGLLIARAPWNRHLNATCSN